MDFSIRVTDSEDNSLPIPKIKVVGVGGGGQNAVNHMIDSEITDVDFISLNTDKQALVNSKAKIKIQIGSKLTKGLGAGSNPQIGEKAAEEDQAKIRDALKDADLVFITAGMGGGTGTGAAPVVARIARDLGALTIAIVTKPFSFEGKTKINKAEEGIRKLRGYVDTLIVIPNDKLTQLSKSSISLFTAFAMSDDILRHSVQGLSEILTKHGFLNVDFQDLKTVLKNQGYALLGIGEGTGENRVLEAVSKALSNNLIENVSIEGAKNAIVNVECASDFQMNEYELIMKTIAEKMDENGQVKLGIIKNESFKDQEKIRVTIIATGFSEKDEQAIAKEFTGDEKIANVGKSRDAIGNENIKEEKKEETHISNGTNGIYERIIPINSYEEIKNQIFGDSTEIPAFLKQKKIVEKN
ncbi:MAG: cell division protein FtsZ [Spirochaetes bacterium]|nr:cell division protein FtsZ [Spirochaetota bacterium]MBP8991275.1 cell division protein FtsZ [Spirochaetota bacterium]NLJ04486.1 cell division protein FtsZ [Exilispira sp.]HOV46024.1 cell division protein FtsZ [Exilispira sp.]